MHFFTRRPWDLPARLITSEEVYRQRHISRRELLTSLGLCAAGTILAGTLIGCSQGTNDEVRLAGEYGATLPAAERNALFSYGRPESDEFETARFTNFYEFTSSAFKDSWRYVGQFDPNVPKPWEVRVDGLCDKPTTFDLDALRQEFALEERCYRHRCVETWAMCVPWTGFPLRELLKKVEPKSTAKFVRFDSFYRPEQCPALAASAARFPWPYGEGLTLAEALNELTFVTLGIYGHALPKQNGAPLRIVVPWKYGFKGPKSVVRIELVDQRPSTFWNDVNSREYGFVANVDPEVPHPRWSQRTEWMLGTRERFDTEPYNGYGEHVAALYS